MKVEFKYCGLNCNLELEDDDDTEVNPIPLMKALIQMVDSISYYKSFNLILTSKEDKEEYQ